MWDLRDARNAEKNGIKVCSSADVRHHEGEGSRKKEVAPVEFRRFAVAATVVQYVVRGVGVHGSRGRDAAEQGGEVGSRSNAANLLIPPGVAHLRAAVCYSTSLAEYDGRRGWARCRGRSALLTSASDSHDPYHYE